MGSLATRAAHIGTYSGCWRHDLYAPHDNRRQLLREAGIDASLYQCPDLADGETVPQTDVHVVLDLFRLSQRD
jgi:hypothetical protein